MSLTPTPKARRVSRRGASNYLEEEHGIVRTPGTLANQAVSGEGPVFQKDNSRATYTTDALDTYAEKQLSPPVKSTAELRELMGVSESGS